MLIPDSIYMPVAIGLLILLAAGVTWLTYKKLGKYGPLAGILAAVFVWVVLQTVAGHFYIVNSENGLVDYRSFGSFEYKYRNGTSGIFESDPGKVQVINNSRDALVLEELVYTLSESVPEGEVFYIEPFSSGIYFLPYRKIDFFFDESIPDVIEEHGSGDKSKYWLHRE